MDFFFKGAYRNVCELECVRAVPSKLLHFAGFLDFFSFTVIRVAVFTSDRFSYSLLFASELTFSRCYVFSLTQRSTFSLAISQLTVLARA